MFKSASRHIYMAAFILRYPPHRGSPKLPEIFDTRYFPKKLAFFEENTLGGRPKMKYFFEKSQVHMVWVFFNQKSVKLQWGNGTKSHQITMGKWLLNPPFPIVISRISG